MEIPPSFSGNRGPRSQAGRLPSVPLVVGQDMSAYVPLGIRTPSRNSRRCPVMFLFWTLKNQNLNTALGRRAPELSAWSLLVSPTARTSGAVDRACQQRAPLRVGFDTTLPFTRLLPSTPCFLLLSRALSPSSCSLSTHARLPLPWCSCRPREPSLAARGSS